MRVKVGVALGAAVAMMAASSAWADGDPAKGEVVFKKCAACHNIGPGAKAKVGPPLNGIVGAPWGHVEDYAFSKPLLAGKAEGKVWDVALLDQYLEAPKKIIPGGKMAFAGLRKPEERADVIAYLAQFNAAGEKQ